jgi:hypothetical protein
MVHGDHRDKPDIGVAIAERWYDRENVDVILDVVNSAVAAKKVHLANSTIYRRRCRPFRSCRYFSRGCHSDRAGHPAVCLYPSGINARTAIFLLLDR